MVQRTKHKNISEVFEVWMLANAYKGSRTCMKIATALVAAAARLLAINIAHTQN